MSYSQFSIDTVETTLGITIVETVGIFADTPPVEYSDFLTQALKKYIPLALAIGTEKARSELILTPILVELMIEPYYPNWLYQELIDNCLPWQEGKNMSFGDFNEQYTLHDSYWIGIFYNIGYEQAITLAIQWDAVWLPDEIKKNITVVDDYPYLFIRLRGIEQVSTANYVEIGDISRIIGSWEFEEIEGKKFLAIDDVLGGQINIVYKGEETFLALEKNKSILNI